MGEASCRPNFDSTIRIDNFKQTKDLLTFQLNLINSKYRVENRTLHWDKVLERHKHISPLIRKVGYLSNMERHRAIVKCAFLAQILKLQGLKRDAVGAPAFEYLAKKKRKDAHCSLDLPVTERWYLL